MNINEINKKLRCYADMLNQDNLDKEDSIDLIEYFKINQKIEVKNGNDYLYEIVGIGHSNYSFGTIDGHKRIFYDPTIDKVVYHYVDNRNYVEKHYEYGYDQINDRLIDQDGEPIREDFRYYGTKSARDEFLSYYKACKNSKPYFPPLDLDFGGPYIDSELNIYMPGISKYSGIRIIANLNDLVKYLLDDKNSNNKCAIELKNILKKIRISIDTLPSVYRDFIEKEKCSDSKIYLNKLNSQY